LEKKEYDIDNIIGKQLSGEANEEEIAFVESWITESDDNRRYVDQLRTIFTRASASKSFQEFDTDAAWRAVRDSLEKKRTRSIRRSQLTIGRTAWRIAASVIIVVGLGYFAYIQWPAAESAAPVVFAAAETVVTDTLPDGSDIVLNKGTTVRYSYDKKNNEHRVGVTGEAYFNIQHDETKTFLVDIDGVLVRDIGTSFNVKAYPNSSTVEVVVESGEVMFYTETDSGVYLRENGKGIYDKVTKTFRIDQPETNVLAYKTKFFTFNNTDLGTVTDALNSVYHKKIVIDDRLKSCHLTVSFNDEQPKEIVAIIAETLGLTIREESNRYILEGPGCSE
jgi:ferric-dicitrate binding protein FerR (iron transport regulator)